MPCAVAMNGHHWAPPLDTHLPEMLCDFGFSVNRLPCAAWCRHQKANRSPCDGHRCPGSRFSSALLPATTDFHLKEADGMQCMHYIIIAHKTIHMIIVSRIFLANFLIKMKFMHGAYRLYGTTLHSPNAALCGEP